MKEFGFECDFVKLSCAEQFRVMAFAQLTYRTHPAKAADGELSGLVGVHRF
jgi:hypothetical protein